MRCRLVVAVLCLLESCATVLAVDSARRIVFPNPQLIHCHLAECSQLWRPDSVRDARAVYPSQIMTDLVNGEVVGLTAVYDKAVTADELQAAIKTLYGKATFHSDSITTWRVEQERFSISVFYGTDGSVEVTYLKFGTRSSLVPSAHIDCRK